MTIFSLKRLAVGLQFPSCVWSQCSYAGATAMMCFCHIASNISFISQPSERLLRRLLSLADMAVA